MFKKITKTTCNNKLLELSNESGSIYLLLKFQAFTSKQPSSIAFDNHDYKLRTETSSIFRII